MSEVSLDQPRAASLASRELAIAAGVGVVFDASFHGQRPGVSIPLFVVFLALAVRARVRRDMQEDLLLAAACVVAIFPALRATEALIVLDLGAGAALFALAAAHDEIGTMRATVESLLRRTGHLFAAALRVPAELLGGVVRDVSALPLGRARSVLRSAVIAGPILATFALLLASSDRVFGELLFFDMPGIDLGSAVGHLALFAIGTAGAATLLLTAARPVPPAMPVERPLVPRAAFGDLAVVLGGIDVLFGIFVGVQFAVLFGGGERVEVTPGLTYAEYARSGFFQLIAVAALTVLVIMASWDLGRREQPPHERWFRGLVTAMIGLCGVILASALMRLVLYENTFGFTLNRLIGYIAIVFIAVILAIVLVAIWTGGRAHVLAAFALAGLCTLLAVNIMSPERFVAERNLARYDRTGKIDAAYLASSLGAEAVPALVEALPRLRPADRSIVRAGLCLQAEQLAAEPGWRSANLGRARATEALTRAGITEERCAAGLDTAPRDG